MGVRSAPNERTEEGDAMSSSRKTDKPRRSRSASIQAERERDQRERIAEMLASETKLSEALVTAFTRSDGKALVAFGIILAFIARTQARKARR
jgi:hypothetical protein